ncbi:MAG: bifunctional UDP-sugar hydrolase/5'-nucleotidase [Candidatus Krumholzibacteriota bacterium]
MSRPPGSKLLLIFLLVLAVLDPGQSFASDPPKPGAGPWNLTLFHTNDTHSYFLPRPASWRDDGRMVGGVIPLAWHLEDQRRTTTNDLFLDAGDFMTGNPVCNLEEDGTPGVAVARMMTALGYDAGVIGNHEFDIGSTNVSALVPHFGFPLLAADIVDEKGEPVFRREPLIITKGDLKIGIMGVSCDGMEEVVAPSRMPGLAMTDQAELARKLAADIDDQTDLLVLITHNGVGGDKELARRLEGSGIDIIVGGHSHSRLKQPVLEGGILIVQAGSKMTNLGRLDLKVADDRVVEYNGRLVTLWSDGTHADPELTKLVQGYEHRVMEEFGQTIGSAPHDLKKGRGESNLGNWLADVMRNSAGADVGVVNSGGIRKGIKAGPVTALDIHEMLPFANALVTVELTDRQLAAVVQQNADAAVSRKHGILQVSGISYTYRRAPDGETAEVQEILVNGKPLAAGGVYTVAMPDFVGMMADVYLNIEMPPVEDQGITMSAAAIASIVKTGTITAEVEGRIRELK